MSLAPSSLTLFSKVENLFATAWSQLQGLFGYSDFSPEESLAHTPGIDPRFIPRVPMSNANLDVNMLSQLGKLGIKRGKEVTAQTHPEFHAAWVELSRRAGLNPPPQMIIAESKVVNALTVSREEVVVTTGLLKRLNMREACAVLGHELGHATSDHTTPRIVANVALVLPGAIAGESFARAGGFAGLALKHTQLKGTAHKAATWLAEKRSSTVGTFGNYLYIAAGLLLGMTAANQLTVRPTELDADRKGARISGDPEGLISALNKLEQGHDKKALHLISWIHSGYPSTEHRISELRKISASMPSTLHPVATDAPVATSAIVEPPPAQLPKPPVAAVPAAKVSAVSDTARVGEVAQAQVG